MKLSKLLKILSSPIKLKLIIHLYTCHERECDVHELVELIGGKQANISKHLSNLRTEGIVAVKKDGLFSYYYISPEFVKKYGVLIEEIIDLESFDKILCKCINDGHEQQTHVHENKCNIEGNK
ncbi:helix-turn-helix transcriptional regulator [Mycoplasma sp. Pen4]|uniref:ArsR/SmtB family transcription factor n=1 Tax=Mycoplasma sp. Pen4 TaxID=640330 RepID=UPI001654510F|nr:metalloregulator ArsR/SmtB family transcription factor [Mycoplasma sp. Pen4]QNM93881.1 helix-turn-helix transcriptional regulator [Mycoplasma sp. Pen4]